MINHEGGVGAIEDIIYQDIDPDLLEARRMYPHLFSDNIEGVHLPAQADINKNVDDEVLVYNQDAKDYSTVDISGIEIERLKVDPAVEVNRSSDSFKQPLQLTVPTKPIKNFVLTNEYILFHHQTQDPILRHSEIFASVVPDREVVVPQNVKAIPPILTSDTVTFFEDDYALFCDFLTNNQSEEVPSSHIDDNYHPTMISNHLERKKIPSYSWCFPLCDKKFRPPSKFERKHRSDKSNDLLEDFTSSDSDSSLSTSFDNSDTLFSTVQHYNWESDILWDSDERKLIKSPNKNSLSQDDEQTDLDISNISDQSQDYLHKTFSLINSSANNRARSKVLQESVTFAISDIHLPDYYKLLSLSSELDKGKDTLITLEADFEITLPSNRIPTYSIFPSVNNDLELDDWEQGVIWDDSPTSQKIKAAIISSKLYVRMNDVYMLFEQEGAGDYQDDAETLSNAPVEKIKKKPRKRHLLLPSRSLQSTEILRSRQDALKHIDKFNLSNDKYYLEGSQAVARAQKSAVLQHSIYALLNVLMKPSLTSNQLKHWHKPLMKLEQNREYTIEVRPSKRKERRKQVLSLDIMKRKKDLSAREGRIIVVEYMEEHPPIIMDIGMASKICNYCRKSKDDNSKSNLSFVDGENVFLETEDPSPFLGDICPGSQLQTIENNLFKAPLFIHNVDETDFLVVRTERKNKPDTFYVREIPAVYVVGQLHPMMEVPAPNSRQSTHYIKQRLQQYVFYMFRQKIDTGNENEDGTMKIKEIQDMFSQSENAIRKRLKVCAEFKRGGDDSGAWVLKPNFQLKSEEEIRAMVTLDDVCTYESQLATAYRLQEMGVNPTQTINAPFHRAVLSLIDPYRSKVARFIGIELELTSWNLTSNFIKAKVQQGLLQLTGLGSATSTHDSYSYLRRPMKVANLKAEKEKEAKIQVTGTDRDLRKLDLPGLKAILKSYGMKDEEIDILPRWDQVDKVRSFANQSKATDEDTEDDKHKFARGSRHNVATHQELYDATCQTIFNNQIKCLSCPIPPELEDEGDDELAELMGVEFQEDLISSSKKTTQQYEEEEERLYQEFVKSLETKVQIEEEEKVNEQEDVQSEGSNTKISLFDDPSLPPVESDSNTGLPIQPGIYAKITRISIDGKEEVIWSVNPKLIEEIERKDRRLATTMNVSLQKRAPTKPLSEIEERERADKKREKRKLQERLRRQKNHAKRQLQLQQVILGNENAAIPKSNNKLRCGRCGMIGHMRTNRDCPFYTEEDTVIDTTNPFKPRVSKIKRKRIESDDSEDYETPEEDFENMDVTLATPSSLPIAETPVRHPSKFVLKLRPNDISTTTTPDIHLIKKQKQSDNSASLHTDVLSPDEDIHDVCWVQAYPSLKSNMPKNISLQSKNKDLYPALKPIVDQIYSIPMYEAFKRKVNAREFPDYPQIVKKPMYMDLIREKLNRSAYDSLDEFLADWELVKNNCIAYNTGTPNENLIDYAKDLFNDVKNAVKSYQSSIATLNGTSLTLDGHIHYDITSMQELPETDESSLDVG